MVIPENTLARLSVRSTWINGNDCLSEPSGWLLPSFSANADNLLSLFLSLLALMAPARLGLHVLRLDWACLVNDI